MYPHRQSVAEEPLSITDVNVIFASPLLQEQTSYSLRSLNRQGKDAEKPPLHGHPDEDLP